MQATLEQAASLAPLVKRIWPEHTEQDLARILGEYIQNPDSVVYTEMREGTPVGVALCCLRHDYVEGCETSPVGYLEGVSVLESCQGQGIARRLVAQCESWARERGCSEFASDCELTNTDSLGFHLHVGFAEENRIICFRKPLPQEETAEQPCKEALARYVEQEIERWDFSGIIRVVQNGSVLYEKCRGYASLEFGIPNTPATCFTLGSVTKQFTAFAIMLLCDRGLVRLDAPACAYLPKELALPENITVHHLLSHTSGLRGFYNMEDDFYVGADRLPYDRDRFFREWIARAPLQAPGQAFDYNNANYNVLAWMIEHVSGMPYNRFLRDAIFCPLGMHATVVDDGLSLLPGKASRYMHDYGKIVHVPYENPLFHIGAGSLVSCCDDLQRWYACLRERKLLSPEGYARFFSPNLAGYCYGLSRSDAEGSAVFSHGGDMNGVAALTHYCFDSDTCILILSNRDGLNQYRLGSALAEILRGGSPEPSHRPQEVPVPMDYLQSLAGEYLPGKARLELLEGRLYAVRPNQNIHTELYHVGDGCFVRRYEEQSTPYAILPPDAAVPTLWGFPKSEIGF